ncbi:MAG TPA: GNAT family N-acetyltransferase [Chitinophagaceae bacterium]|jgi:ribosomal protein S18 acetylase RimI-like enzyme|nr:GNAT family N-acetyltransferase [Chitinophagaceae bacterium]
MENKYWIEVGTNSQQVMELLEDKIYEHNSSNLDKHDGCLFSRIARDANNNVIAGIAGWTWAGICEITQLWVDENIRKMGIGKRLLAEAELEAKSKGCVRIMIRSFSFQAPHFYERQGYRIEHVLDSFPKGCCYYILLKTFD